ncbi:MAG: helix-turn-helix transcriptional regulator [Lachnospiraceae bacterium]|nr:helix-turn-helix transcriptional regulator [Lachnospiraceae bacterium]
MTIGKRISRLRKEKRLSQEYLAEQLDVSRQAVSKWENDLSSPDTGNLIQLSSLLGVSVEYLATGKEPDHHTGNAKTDSLVKTLKRLSLLFFLLALASHLIGLFSGEFTDNLIPVFPYLWYGKSAAAIVLNAFTFLFTVVWVVLLSTAHSMGKSK